MFWALALGGLFIPVAHFILVPTFVVTGIVVAVKRAREDRRLVLLRGAVRAVAQRKSSNRGAASPPAAASIARRVMEP